MFTSNSGKTTTPPSPSPALPEDCLQCRIVGTVTFGSVSAYASYLRAVTPKSEKGNRLFFACFSVGAAAVAVHRAFFT